MSILVKLVLAALLVVPLAACSNHKTGKVAGISLQDGQIALMVKLADGKEVCAFRSDQVETNEVTGGATVEIKPKAGSKCWQVVKYIK